MIPTSTACRASRALPQSDHRSTSAPLPWKEGERVSVVISSRDSPILKAYGIMGWKGTSEELDRLLAEIEFDEDEVP